MIAAKAAGYTMMPEFFYRNRLDVTKTRKLRRAGVDMLLMDRQILIDGSYPYKEQTLYADVVVRGRVTAEVTDSSHRVYFHTTFKVKVEEVWQGRLAADTITVQQMAGPVGRFRMHIAEGSELHLGEEVILYLSPVDFAAFAEAEKQGLSGGANNAVPGDFYSSKAIPVQKGRIAYGRAKIELAQARRQVKRIAAILDKGHFYQKFF